MDQQKLRSLVFEKTGIKIDTSDPVFAVVAMNEALLEEAVQRHLLVLEQSSQAILQQLHALRATHGQAGGGSVPASVGHDDIWETSIAHTTANVSQTGHAQERSVAENAPASEVANASATSTSHAAAASPVNNQPPAGPSVLQGQLRLAAMTALMTVALMLPTMSMFGSRQNNPPVPASGLTPQQQNQVRQAEKLQKLLPNLDAKTRALIEAELQKP